MKTKNSRLSVSSVVTYTDIDAGDLWFDCGVGQIGQSVADGSPPLQRFFRVVLPRR